MGILENLDVLNFLPSEMNLVIEVTLLMLSNTEWQG